MIMLKAKSVMNAHIDDLIAVFVDLEERKLWDKELSDPQYHYKSEDGLLTRQSFVFKSPIPLMDDRDFYCQYMIRRDWP